MSGSREAAPERTGPRRLFATAEAAIAAFLAGRSPPERRRRAMARIVEAVSPRSLLVIGAGPELCELRGGRLTVFLRSDCGEGVGRWIRHFAGSIDSFFEHDNRHRLLSPWWRGPGAFCDLAIVDGGLDGAEAEALVRHLPIILLTSTVVVLPADARKLADRLSTLRDGGAVLPMGRKGILVSGRPPVPGEGVAAFLARHRVGEPPAPPPLVPVADAPSTPSAVVQPDYLEVGGAPRLMKGRPDGNMTMGDWWGKPLQLLPAGIGVADATFQRANGLNFSVLAASNGGLFDASFVWRRGFGPKAIDGARTPGATYLRDGDVRRPLTDAAVVPVIETTDEPLLLLGYIEPRFGHLLTETLSRAWAVPWALARGMRVLVWTENDWTPLQREALALLGLTPERIEVARAGTRYRRLHVPSDGFRLRSSVAPIVAEGWGHMVANALAAAPDEPTPSRVYLSRRLIERRRLENEEALEAFLAREGYACVCPEMLSFAAQVRLVARAERLVSCAGSQMHLSVFAKAGAERLVIAQEYFLGSEDILFSVANGSRVAFHVQPQRRVAREVIERVPWTLDLRRFRRGYARWQEVVAARAAAQPVAAAGASL